MNWLVTLNLLRLNCLTLALLGLILIVCSVFFLSYLDNLVLQILLGAFLIAPFMGSVLSATGPSLSHWGRATFLLPIARTGRILVVWWARVLVPAVWVWVLVVLTLATSATRSLSWASFLIAIAAPFAASAWWFFVSASAGAGYWTYCSRKGPARKFLATVQLVAFVSIPLVLAPWIEMRQVLVTHGLALILVGVVFCVLGLKRLHSICVAEPANLVESRVTNASRGNFPGTGNELRGFKLNALEMILTGSVGILPLTVLVFVGFKVLQLLGILQGADLSFLKFFSFVMLVLSHGILGEAIFLLRALRALPFNAGQISLRLTVLVAVFLLFIGTAVSVLAWILYDGTLAMQILVFWLGGIGIISCTAVPASLHMGPKASTLRSFLIALTGILPTALWFGVSESMLPGYLAPIGLVLAALGLGLSWILIRAVILRSSRAYTSKVPFSPMAMRTSA